MMALLSFLLGDVAVGAWSWSRRLAARTVCGTLVLKAMPLRPSAGDGLLLDVDRLAVLVVRADVDGAGRPRRADAVAGHVAVAGQHVDVVAQRLEVVGDVVAGHVALVVQLRHLLVGLLRQVAAEATRVPRRMAGDAAHVALGMSTRACRRCPERRPRPFARRARSAPSWPGGPSRCSARWPGRWCRSTCTISQHRSFSTIEFWIDLVADGARSGACRTACAGPPGCGRSCRTCSWPGRRCAASARCVDRAVAVDALDLDGRAHLAVSLVLPCTSWMKWQSTQCIPFSRWMSIRCTGHRRGRHLPPAAFLGSWAASWRPSAAGW